MQQVSHSPEPTTPLASADPNLLSLLQRVSNPIKSLSLDLELKGVFSPVQQWKTSDQASPNIFGYVLQVLGKDFQKGKIHPRQLTEKQIRQAQQAKMKKGGKKDSKVEEQRKLSPEEEQEEARKKAKWEAMTDQERFYFKAEDPFQMFSMKFEKPALGWQLDGAELERFQKEVERGFVEVVLLRRPEVSEDEIAKMKKSKPKGLNLGELTKLTFKGKLNLEAFRTPGCDQITQRIKLQQVEQGLPADAPKYEMKDCYVYLTIHLSPALTPYVQNITPEVHSLLKLQPKSSGNDLSTLIQKLKGQIVVAVKSISTEYSNLFAKEKQLQQEKKSMSQTSHFPQIKVAEVNKRKEMFLEEFYNNGKYALLRSRLDRIIKAICIDKFKKQRGLGKPKPQQIHRTLSELSVFLNQQISATIDDFLTHKPQQLHQDILLSHRVSRDAQSQILQPITSESVQDRCIRISVQYQIINRLQQAEQNLQNLTLMNPSNDNFLAVYVNFCLRHKKFDNAESLLERLLRINDSLENRTIYGILMLRRRRYKEAMAVFRGLIEDATANNQQKTIYNQLAAMTLRKQGDVKQSEKFKTMAQKLYKIKLNLPVKLDQQQDPYLQPRPKIPKPSKTASLLTPQQSQQLQSGLLHLLSDYNFLDLVSQQLHLISDSPKKTLWLTQASVFDCDYSTALSHINQLIESNPKNYDWLMLKADICFIAERLFESEEVFLKVIKMKPNAPKTFAIYLRLGNIYLIRKAWEDAKSIFLKACELKSNSSLSWLGLGRAHLNFGEIEKAQEALNLANIYEPFNKEVEKYLTEVRRLKNEQISVVSQGEIDGKQ